jgi:hypothetical protein
MVRQRVLSESGIKALQEVLAKAGAPDSLTYKRRPLSREGNLQLLLAEKSLIRARIGLILLTVGFLLDFLGKLVAETCK